MSKAKRLKLQTSLLHATYDDGADSFASRAPLNVSTAFAYKSAEKLSAVFAGTEHGFLYSRIHNPTVAQFEKAMAVLEGGIGALACASGMAAITCAVLAFVTAGDTVLSSSSLFGGTFSLLTKTLQRLGINVQFFDPTDPDSIDRLMDETTKVVFTEIIGNPKMDVAQVDRIAEAVHKAAIPLIVDNTLAPCIFRGASHGADLIVHSTSKYVDGQGRVIGGCLIDTGSPNWDRAKYEYLQDYTTQFGQDGLLTFIRYELMSNLGCCFSPYHADLHMAGLETLPLRMERHCHNALELARFLQSHSRVSRVRYPGLPDDPGHDVAARLFNGGFGGLLAFEVDSEKRAFQVINRLKIALRLANLGDAKTLVIHPASTIYAAIPPWQHEALGVNDRLIRVSVGLEDAEDIIGDFKKALEG